MVGLRVLFTQKTYGRSGLPPNSVPKVVHNYAVCNGHLFGDENLTFFLSHLGHFFFFSFKNRLRVLWNFIYQYPTSISTNHRLIFYRCIGICREVHLFIFVFHCEHIDLIKF